MYDFSIIRNKLLTALMVIGFLLPLAASAQTTIVSQVCINDTTARVTVSRRGFPAGLWRGPVGTGTFLGSYSDTYFVVDLVHNTHYSFNTMRTGHITNWYTPNCTPPAPYCSVSI